MSHDLTALQQTSQGQPMRDDAATPIRLTDYQPCDFVIDEIALTFALDADQTLVKARCDVRRVGGADAPLMLNGVNLQLERIALDGAVLPPEAYKATPTHLVIAEAPDAFTLEIDTIIRPAANTALEGLYVSAGRFCTQCEAEGFRKITYALDRPDALSRYTVRIEADKARYPTLLSNGDPVAAGDLPEGRHFAIWRDPHKKPCYLFALVAGAFDTITDRFTTMSGREVALAIHVDPGDSARAPYAMDALKRAMRWDEEKFGREYDLSVFNIVAVRDFNFGAMENKGLNVFNSAYVLADPETATDADYEAIESVVAHEYFHNWTGNRITLRDWFQLCLKEGLTVFRDQEFSADQRSRPVQRIKDVKRLRARQFPEDAGPLAHPARPTSYFKIDNFYTATVYEKGAEIVRVLRELIGAAAFRAGMDLYFDRCDGAAATLEDFIACFEEAAGRDLSDFMRWYGQAGTPALEVSSQYDAAAQSLSLEVRQSTPPTPNQPEKSALPIPLRVGLISADGAILAARVGDEADAREEHLLTLERERQNWRFTGVVRPPTLALLRGFSAPVTLRQDVGVADRLAQMAHDPDAYTRWEAGQALAREAIIAGAEGAPFALDDFAAALSREIDRAQQDPAFAALALRLPDLPEMIQIAPAPDPDRLYAAREAVRAALAARLEAKLTPLARTIGETPFSPSAAAAGRRALKAAALDLLAALGAESAPLLSAAFDSATNMTEQMAALEALAASNQPAFDTALAAFQRRWTASPLVMDKWFAVQAGAARDDSLERVLRLRAHADFDLRNPNRVRALAAPFAVRNPRAFHTSAGYAFVAGLAKEVDVLNPALAARLLGPFETWRRLDSGRQAAARATLEGLLEKSDLSPNSREIVQRTLA